MLKLHHNDLTGIMPFSICSKRGVGANRLEILTADCNIDSTNTTTTNALNPQVTCTCCTECF